MQKLLIKVWPERGNFGIVDNQAVETDANPSDLATDIKTLVDKGVLGKMTTGEILQKLGVESDSHDTGESTIPEEDLPK